MEGIEILNQQVVSILEPDLPFILSVLGVWIIGITILFVCNEMVSAIFATIVGFLIVLPLCTTSQYCKTKTDEYLQYKITISEEVNFNQFNNKYEIISQEGKIYTVKEREDN